MSAKAGALPPSVSRADLTHIDQQDRAELKRVEVLGGSVSRLRQ